MCVFLKSDLIFNYFINKVMPIGIYNDCNKKYNITHSIPNT